jgi:hypothetical protein
MVGEYIDWSLFDRSGNFGVKVLKGVSHHAIDGKHDDTQCRLQRRPV